MVSAQRASESARALRRDSMRVPLLLLCAPMLHTARGAGRHRVRVLIAAVINGAPSQRH